MPTSGSSTLFSADFHASMRPRVRALLRMYMNPVQKYVCPFLTPSEGAAKSTSAGALATSARTFSRRVAE